MTIKIDDSIPIPTGPHWVEVELQDASYVVGDKIYDAGFVIRIRFAPDCVRYLVADRPEPRRCDPGGW